MQTAVHVVPEIDVRVSDRLTVRDSVNEVVANARVEFYQGSQLIKTSSTDSQGVLVTGNLPEGTYTIKIIGNNVSPMQFQKVLYKNYTNDRYDVFMNRILLQGEMEFVLSWRDTPRDLDAHLYSTKGDHG